MYFTDNYFFCVHLTLKHLQVELYTLSSKTYKYVLQHHTRTVVYVAFVIVNKYTLIYK